MALQHAATAAVLEETWRRYLVGRSPAIEKLIEKVRLIGPKRATVLITGETGTGKEVTARAIHAASERSNAPFVTVNCTALPESLLEAELFGHVKGAFTGAVQNRVGRFERADGGTIFLDEIGDMPRETQSKLLRVLQDREFQRIGSSESVRVDVRVVAATNADVEARIARGRFREDLYYRLNVVPIRIPALRERRSDIPILADHFLYKICRQENVPLRRLAQETIEMLAAHSWPGNVRQLENSIEMAIALSGDRLMLFPADFSLPRIARQRGESEAPLVPIPGEGLNFEETIGRIELQILEHALRRTGGNKTLAADMLGLKRTTLSAKLRSLSKTVGSD